MPFIAGQLLPASWTLQHFAVSTEKKPGGTFNIVLGSSQLQNQIRLALRVCSVLMMTRSCTSAFRTFIAF